MRLEERSIEALARQFARTGTPGLENPHVFEMS